MEKLRKNQWKKQGHVIKKRNKILNVSAQFANHSSFQETRKESPQATDRLMKEIRECYTSKLYKNKEYSIELVDDSLYDWNVMVRSIDADSELYKDLQVLKQKEGQDGILFNFKFGPNYPFEAPFVRVVYPVIRGNAHLREKSSSL